MVPALGIWFLCVFLLLRWSLNMVPSIDMYQHGPLFCARCVWRLLIQFTQSEQPKPYPNAGAKSFGIGPLCTNRIQVQRFKGSRCWLCLFFGIGYSRFKASDFDRGTVVIVHYVVAATRQPSAMIRCKDLNPKLKSSIPNGHPEWSTFSLSKLQLPATNPKTLRIDYIKVSQTFGSSWEVPTWDPRK